MMTPAEAHEQKEWDRVLRRDVCSYCFGEGGTVEHLKRGKKRRADRRTDANKVGACLACNRERNQLQQPSPLAFFVYKMTGRRVWTE